MYDYCEFLVGIVNKWDSVELSIYYVNYEVGFVDLVFKNLNSNVMVF